MASVEKKYLYKVSLSAEGNTLGTIKLTEKEAALVARVTNPENWDSITHEEDWSGDFFIDLDNPVELDEPQEPDELQESVDATRETSYRFGDYVITGVRNQFNHNTSWWISKRGNTDAFYCFTANTASEIKYHLERYDGYIKLYEAQHARCINREFIVKTPAGNLRVYAKHKKDDLMDYPGVIVEYVDGEKRDRVRYDILVCTEYDSVMGRLQTCVYNPDEDEPVEIVVHE